MTRDEIRSMLRRVHDALRGTEPDKPPADIQPWDVELCREIRAWEMNYLCDRIVKRNPEWSTQGK